MPKLYEKNFNKSLQTIYLLIGCLCIISDKCINCWSLEDSVAAAYTFVHSDQIELNFSILEDVAIGTLIGVIKSSNSSVITQPPYLIVPVFGTIYKSNSSRSLSANTENGDVETDLNIDQSTGEIRTAILLDREQRGYYAFIAIPLTGANIKVTITIEDINDNSPQFPTDEIDLEFPENSKPRDVKRTLPPARDLDLGQFGTQKYRIVSGNIGNAFRLLSHREKDDVLYLDLQVNGPLDRETISTYTLVIEALDGGQPQLKDEMTVRIAILDHNDCEPVFSQSHYYGNVAENVTIGTSFLSVTATDNDQGDNGLITYSIHSKNSALSGLSTHFGINKINGWMFVAKPLDFESKELHELVVIARDSGAQPLETSAHVSIRVTDINDNQPTIGLLFLTETARPEILENARIGDLVARVSVNDADSTNTSPHSDSNGETMTGLSISLAGSEGSFGLTSQDNVVHLIVVTGPLDRENKSRYSLTVIVTDQGNPPLNTTISFELEILAINHNPPYFENDTYRNDQGSDISGIIKAEDNSSVNSTIGVNSSTSVNSTATLTSLPDWILFLIVLLMLTTVVLLVSIVVICLHQHQQQHLMSDHVRHIGPHNIGSLLRKIGTFGETDPNLASYQSHHTSHYGSAPPVRPCYNDVTLSSSAALASGEGHSASSGRGSAEEEEVEEDIDDVDEEIRMINENSNYYGEDNHVTTTAEYLAQLGVINHHEEDRGESSTALEDDEEDDMLEQLGAISTPRISSIRGQSRTRIGTTSSVKSEDWSQINGSMSSIVQAEEELSGSYNWDYLQNWGPKYQPLSSVFAEIARLKATNGEQDLSAVETMAVECGSTRSSSTTSSSQRMSHRHQIPPQITARVLSVHPTPTFTPQINSAFQPFNPLISPPIIESLQINNGFTIDEEITI